LSILNNTLIDPFFIERNLNAEIYEDIEKLNSSCHIRIIGEDNENTF